MSLFNFSHEELLTFFAVLVRFGTLVAVLPVVGDKMVPVPAKVLFALAVSFALYPALTSSGQVRPGDAAVWGATTGGIVSTVALEAVFGLVLGYTAKLLFDAIEVGANISGQFMGFSMATAYDPMQESQTLVVSQLQGALAMLLFLSLDGHHLMLRSSLESYSIVGLGAAGFGQVFGNNLVEMTGQVLRFGLQLAAPVAIAMFAVQVAFAVVAKAVPQMNILILSFSISAMVGIFAMWVSVPEVQSVSGNVLERMDEWLKLAAQSMAGR
ncbi:MAG: hypothetical protein A2583_02335 [Bdellovibrionales bacterium RIFOXYD1_FULL_53_11]|nr:MAG: hypothetical protein A2583_02335 [Bdellovibrionales bacterium RIFOXYD1_FULL_53_11]